MFPCGAPSGSARLSPCWVLPRDEHFWPDQFDHDSAAPLGYSNLSVDGFPFMDPLGKYLYVFIPPSTCLPDWSIFGMATLT